MASQIAPAFIPGQHTTLRTLTGSVSVVVRDMQKRSTSFVFLVESLVDGALAIVWPEETLCGCSTRGVVAINPNISMMDRCFTSRIYIAW